MRETAPMDTLTNLAISTSVILRVIARHKVNPYSIKNSSPRLTVLLGQIVANVEVSTAKNGRISRGAHKRIWLQTEPVRERGDRRGAARIAVSYRCLTR